MEKQDELEQEAQNMVDQAAANPIITPYDNARWPLLEIESQPCNFPLTSSDISELERMDNVLTELGDEAAGLAAVQIGYPKRIFMLRRNEENKVFINPTLISVSNEKHTSGEACLSLPGVFARFKRPKAVTIHFQDLDGDTHTEDFRGFWARAVMHEMDHLNGTLIIEHIEKQQATTRRSRSFRNQEGFMYITPDSTKAIRKRRAKNKLARTARKRNR